MLILERLFQGIFCVRERKATGCVVGGGGAGGGDEPAYKAMGVGIFHGPR
jgi:hypothetical protein